jgi:hypothetical protein
MRGVMPDVRCWYDFGTIYTQNRSTLLNYFQLGVWTKFKFDAGFIEFCAKGKIDNSAFAMQRSGVTLSCLAENSALGSTPI